MLALLSLPGLFLSLYFNDTKTVVSEIFMVSCQIKQSAQAWFMHSSAPCAAVHPRWPARGHGGGRLPSGPLSHGEQHWRPR